MKTGRDRKGSLPEGKRYEGAAYFMASATFSRSSTRTALR